MAAAISVSAQVTISGSDFNNSSLAGAYNGTYVSTPFGHEHLAFTAVADDAVVGAKGPFGILSALSMSFEYSNLSGGNGNQPYAAFGLSENNLWNLSAQEFLVIAVSGNQLDANTLVHVVNNNSGSDYIPLSGAITLGQLATYTFGGEAFGDMEVMRAYAYIGAWPSVGNTSVDIDSITVTTVPEPTVLSLLLLASGVGASRLLRRNHGA